MLNSNLKKLQIMASSVKTKPMRLPQFTDEPRVAHFVTSIGKTDDGGRGLSLFNEKEAELKSIAEFFERLSATTCSMMTTAGTYEKVSANKLAIHPAEFSPFHPNQMISFDFSRFKLVGDEPYRWTSVTSLTDKSNALIPVQLVKLERVPAEEKIIRFPDSSGLSLGVSQKDALLRGLLEVIERDSLISSWYEEKKWNKLTDLELPVKIKKVISYLNRYKLRVEIFDISNDLTPYIFFAIIWDESPNPDCHLSVGSKASDTFSKSILGAIEEALQGRYIGKYSKLIQDSPSNVLSYKDHVKFWAKEGRTLEHLIQNKITDCGIDGHVKTTRKPNVLKLSDIIRNAKKKEVRIFYKDLTNKLLFENGFSCVKVISPDLKPLFADQNFPYFGFLRGRDLGNYTFFEEERFKVPHPFG